jgi:hypothetical protein
VPDLDPWESPNWLGDPTWPAPVGSFPPGWEDRLQKAAIALGKSAAEQMDLLIWSVLGQIPPKIDPK